MAKQQGSVPDKDLKKLLEQLFNAVQLVTQTTKDTTRVNRDLLKVMALLDSGFAANKEDAQDLMDQVVKGLQITDELTIKWAKQRKIAKEDLDQLLKKYRQLEDLDEETISNSKDYIELLQIRRDLVEDDIDLTKKLLKNQNLILKVIRDSKNAGIQVTDEFGNMDKVFAQILAKKGNFTGVFDDTKSSIGQVSDLLENIKSDISGLAANVSGQFTTVDLKFNPLSGQLDDEIDQVLDNIQVEKNARLDDLSEFFKTNTKAISDLSRQAAAEFSGIDFTFDIDTGEIDTLNGTLKKGTAEFETMVSKLDDIANSNGIIEKLASNFSEINKLVGLGAARTEDEQKALEKLLKPMGLQTKFQANLIEGRISELSVLEENIRKQGKIYKAVQQYTDKLKTSESIVLKIGEGFDYINSILPTGISEFLGLSKISGALIDSHKRGVQDFTAKLVDGKDHVEAMNSYFKAFGPSIKLALNPLMLMVVGAALLFKFVENITGKYKELSREMKTSLGQSKQMFQVQLDTLTSQKNQFATMEDLQQIQAEMIGQGGKVFDQMDKGAKELSIDLVEIGKYFGYGNQQAVQLHKTFERLGASDKLALQLQRNVGFMAEMAGLSPQIVSQDLIDSAEEVATYFAGLPDEAAKAVIEVRKMGMSLKQAGQIAHKMLELDSFMTDMYELQAMSNGGIDFSSAFEKGLMGDIQGMTEDIMNNIGTTADYNKMDYLTRSKIANTLGMTNDELAKSVMLHEKMSSMDEKSKAYLDANLSRMGDISAMSQEDIRNKMQSLQSTDRLAVAWDKIKGTLVDALLPLVESFADGISAISPILDIVIMGFKGIGGVIKLIAPLVSGILAPFKWLAGGLEKLTGITDEFAGSLSGIKPILDGIGKVLYYVGAGIGLLFAPRIFTSFISGIGSMLKHIPIIGSLFGSIGRGAKDQVSSAANSIKEMSLNVMSSIGTMTSSIRDSMVNVAKSIKETFTGISASAKNVISTASTSTSSVSTAIEKTAAKASKATKKMTKEAQVAKNSISSGSKLSFMSSDTAKSTFGTIGSIASKTFAIMAVRSAASFFTMKKDGEEATSEMTDNMSGMFDMAFMGVGSMLSSYLGEGIEKVFTKKVEGRIDGVLQNPIKKAAKAFGTIDAPITSTFGRITEKGKSAFSKIIGFAKKMLPGSTTSISGTFDNMASSATKAIPKLETIQDVTETVRNKSKEIVEKTISKKTTGIPKVSEAIPKAETVKLPDTAKPIKEVGSKLGSGLTFIKDILKSVWNGIKTVLTDIVKFVSTSMKELSSGIGTAIKNVLKGIGDGLSSFKTSAIKGAASLVILSGALWITSKALKNFQEVKWEDIAKAGVAIGGLVAAGILLGGGSVAMILGATALGLLGAALIPTAYALEMFNGIKWSSLAKAGVALIGLGVAGTLLGASSPAMLLGAGAIAALGGAMMIASVGINSFSEIDWSTLGKAGIALAGLAVIGGLLGAASPLILAGSLAMASASVGIMLFSTSLSGLNLSLTNLDFSPLKSLTSELMQLTSIPVLDLFGIASGIGAIGTSILAFNSMSSIGTVLSGLFGGGDFIKDLEKLGNLADPLYIVNNVLKEIGGNLLDLSKSIEGVDFSKFGDLKEFGKMGIEATVQKKIQPRISDVQSVPKQTGIQHLKMSPFQTPVATSGNPKKGEVAQDKAIVQPPHPSAMAQDKKIDFAKGFRLQEENRIKSNRDNYRDKEDEVPDNNETNMLLRQMIQLMTALVQKDPVIQMDHQLVGAILKKGNNK